MSDLVNNLVAKIKELENRIEGLEVEIDAQKEQAERWKELAVKECDEQRPKRHRAEAQVRRLTALVRELGDCICGEFHSHGNDEKCDWQLKLDAILAWVK